MIRNYINKVKEYFTLVQFLIYFVLYFGANFLYIFIISDNTSFSILVATVAAIVCFMAFTYEPYKLFRYQFLLNELGKYTRNVSFYLKTSGTNPVIALRNTMDVLDPEVQKDVGKLIKSIEDTATLETEQFKKYKFSPLDIFHQILEIKYHHGTDKKAFDRVNHRISNELINRDETFRKKKYVRSQVLSIMGLALAIPVMVKYMVGDMYVDFLSSALSLIVIAVFYGILLMVAYLLQKSVCDISLDV